MKLLLVSNIKMRILCSVFIVIVILYQNVNGDIPVPKFNPKNESSSRKLGPCQACKVLIESFKRGMEKTARGKFEGGDAAWEEEKLGSYQRSEVRLVEIQERLCNDAEEFKDQCHTVAEEAEHFIEEWWFQSEEDGIDIYNYVCIDKLKNCCPKYHFGKDCKPCVGGIDNVCNGNGKCKGDGTRKGNGECLCDNGYTGKSCSECADGFYESYKDDSKILCSPCHKSCKDVCSQGGTKGCSVCREGWLMDTDKGCVDINECEDSNACQGNTFCVNNEGSYKCLQCDRSCAGCSGDGPDMCNACAKGYKLKDNICVDGAKEDAKFRVTFTRYITYLGLCVTVCIIFNKSYWLSGILGLMVALYISISEYMLANDTAGPEPVIDTSKIDWASLFNKGPGR